MDSEQVSPRRASLVIAFVRSELIRRHYEDAVVQRYDTPQDTLVLWGYLSLWLASLYVVLEGWEKQSLSDPALLDSEVIELSQSPNADRLRHLRNKVFHPELWNHEQVKVFLADRHEAVAWAERLSSEFRRLFETMLSDFSWSR